MAFGSFLPFILLMPHFAQLAFFFGGDDLGLLLYLIIGFFWVGGSVPFYFSHAIIDWLTHLTRSCKNCQLVFFTCLINYICMVPPSPRGLEGFLFFGGVNSWCCSFYI